VTSNTIEIIFWICMGAVLYHYVLYPVLLFVLCALVQAKSDAQYLLHRHNRRSPSRHEIPRIALLVSAYNEEAVIQSKINNCLAIDYPPERLELLFGVDAATDRTADILERAACDQLRVFRYEARRGKLAVLCDLLRETSADILVLTDANTILDPSSVRSLVRHFSDPRVGAVSGEEVRVAAPGSGPSGESLYWRYESALKILESRLNCSLGGNGAVLALRRSLFNPTPGLIVEDFQIPLEIRFKGFQVVYDPEATAVEEVAPTLVTQFKRRVRIGAGNYQTLFKHPEYLNPFRGLLSFTFISHRLFRWLGPLFLLSAFCSNVALSLRPAFASLLGLQCLFYLSAVIGYLLSQHGKSAWICSLPMQFCTMNLALLLGLASYITGRQGAVWAATPRTAPLQLGGSLTIASASAKALDMVEQRPAA
jgi:cellulose synthase/poly-beta-1,6-N-acetylglucosamine synthase-like glycosyltransferase